MTLCETAKMAEKRRALPSWMAKKEEKAKESEPMKSKRKCKTSKAVFYCMNERELVETAVSLLTDAACKDVALLADQKVEDKVADSFVGKKGASTSREKLVIEEESSDCSDAQETTYISETDLDVSEMETLPFTENPAHQEPRGQRSDSVQGQGALRNVGVEAERKVEHSQMPADAGEEDGALQLVREIFFTR